MRASYHGLHHVVMIGAASYVAVLHTEGVQWQTCLCNMFSCTGDDSIYRGSYTSVCYPHATQVLHVLQALEQRAVRYGLPRYILLASIRTKVVDELLLKQLTAPKASEATEPNMVAEDGQTALNAHSTDIKQQVAHIFSRSYEALVY